MVPRRTPAPLPLDCCGGRIAAQSPLARAEKTQAVAASDYTVSTDPSTRLPAAPGSAKVVISAEPQ